MKKLLLLFLSSPLAIAALSPLFFFPQSAQALEPLNQDPNGNLCIQEHTRLVCVRSSKVGDQRNPDFNEIIRVFPPAGDPDYGLDFSYEESDQAIQIFGCDCGECVRALRTLKALSS
jgi:hypothetical protein